MSHIGTLAQFPNHSSLSIVVDQRALLVVRRNEELYIYDNRCPHTSESLDPMGGSVVSEDGLLIQCQRHAAQFLPATGECVGGPCQGEHLQAVPFTLSNGDIYLD